jgi:hypothetical protein
MVCASKSGYTVPHGASGASKNGVGLRSLNALFDLMCD